MITFFASGLRITLKGIIPPNLTPKRNLTSAACTKWESYISKWVKALVEEFLIDIAENERVLKTPISR